MLHFLVSSLAVFGIALFYCRLFRRSFVQTISASVFSVSMMLYVLSVFSVPLRLACILVMLSGWLCLIVQTVSMFKRRCRFSRIDTSALIVYALCILFALTFLHDKLAIGWDEFSHWMLTIKNMFHFNSLGLGELSSTEYQSYPPAIQLFEIFHLILHPDFREHGAFMARVMLLTSMLFGPAFSKTRNPITAAAKFLILFVSPVAFYGSTYSMLYIDAVLGFMFSHLIWLYFSEEHFDLFFFFQFALSSAVLALVKGTGLALFFLALFVILSDILIGRNQKLFAVMCSKKKRFFSCIALLIAVPLIVTLSWNLYQRIHNINSFWNVQSSINLQSILQLLTSPKAYQIQTLDSFRYSYKYPMTLGVLSISFSLYPFCFIALCAFSGLCARRIRRGTLLGLTLAISYWIYVASILATYLLVFPEVEAVGLSSFRRYLNNLALGCSLCVLSLLLNPSILSDESSCTRPILRLQQLRLMPRTLLPFFLAFSFPLLSGGASSLCKQYISARKDTRYVISHRAEHEHLIRMAESIEDTSSQIYYLYQSVNNGHYQMARLHVSPIRLNRRDFCIAATPEHTFDTYTAIKTPEEWSSELADAYQYVYLDLIDEAFISDYSVLFESPEVISSHALYKVIPAETKNDLVLLKLIDQE